MRRRGNSLRFKSEEKSSDPRATDALCVSFPGYFLFFSFFSNNAAEININDARGC